MAKTSGPTGTNGSDNRGGIHLTLQGKGGVGKSLIASVLAQYFKERGRDVRCVDTDPGNRTLAQYGALGADRLNLRDEHNRIDQRCFDNLTIVNHLVIFVPTESVLIQPPEEDRAPKLGIAVYLFAVEPLREQRH